MEQTTQRVRLVLAWHIPALCLVVFCSLFVRNAWPLAAVVCAVGIPSFAIGSLCDATETSRHILLYQEATDTLYIVAIYLVFQVRDGQYSWRQLSTS